MKSVYINLNAKLYQNKRLINFLNNDLLINVYNYTIVPKKKRSEIIKRKLDIFINYLIVILANPFPSRKNIYYLKNNKNFIKKNLIKFKIFISKFNLLPSMSNLYYFYFFFYKKKNYYFDYILCDFRLSTIYNNSIEILFRSLKKKTKLICIVNSWDNIFHSNVMKHADKYIVWSNYNKKLLNKIHNIKKDKIIVIPPLSFQYLNKYKVIKKKQKKILFICAHNCKDQNTNDNFFFDEITMIEKISKKIFELNRDYKLIVRTYPNVHFSKYNKLLKLRNVRLSFTNLNEKNYEYKKFKEISEAKFVMGFGSTMNLEAALKNKIVIHISFTYSNNKMFNEFINHMSHLKIISPKRFLNVVNNKHELEKSLTEILKYKKLDVYTKYNNLIKSNFFDKTIFNKSLIKSKYLSIFK